jgi:uncharacterized paraquat-inducible protein A
MTAEDDAESLIDCPECNRSMDEDSTMCPGCGYFLMEEDRRQASGSRSPYRGCFVAVAILLILLFLVPMISRFFSILTGS